MMLTIDEARAYTHDYDSEDDEIAALIAVAESTISGICGEGFDRADPRAKMLAKLIVADLTDARGLSAKDANSRRGIVEDMMLQLRTETAKKAPAGRILQKEQNF